MVSNQVSMILLTTAKHQTLLHCDQTWFHCLAPASQICQFPQPILKSPPRRLSDFKSVGENFVTFTLQQRVRVQKSKYIIQTVYAGEPHFSFTFKSVQSLKHASSYFFNNTMASIFCVFAWHSPSSANSPIFNRNF